MNIDSKDFSVSNIEHLGIVAGTIKEINLAKRIDALLGGKEKNPCLYGCHILFNLWQKSVLSYTSR